jgi:hypothetical protein
MTEVRSYLVIGEASLLQGQSFRAWKQIDISEVATQGSIYTA